MAKPSFQFFLNQASRRKNPINRLGMIYAGKQIALHLAAKYKLDPRQVLIRSDAHPWTYSTDMLGVVPDDLHFTVDIKDSKMMQDNTHLTAHGYVKELKTTDDFSNLFNIGSVEVKEDKKGAIKIEKDQYFDKKKKYVNNWNMAKLEAFDEPEEMSRMRLGDKFTDVLSSELAKIDDNHQAKHTQEAVKEEQQVREALEREGNDKLGKD